MLKTVGFPSTRTGDQTIVDGNLVIATAGKGIDFSADPSAPGMTSELLDDYEEGTFTAAYRSNSATIVMTAGNTGRYTKIGRVVTIQATITTDSFSGGSLGNFLYFTGLPFIAGYGSVALIGSAYSWGLNSPSSAEVNNGSNEALMYTRLTANAGVTPMTYGDLAAGAAQNGINIVMTYTV
jgi:hypothetical protein